MGSGPAPLVHRIPVVGTALVAYEWAPGGRDAGDTILLAHATGFHARCWDQVVARLGVRRVVALDQRGHGASEGTLPVHWRQFGEDLAALVRALDLGPVLGVGHSMGGHAMVEAAAIQEMRDRFADRPPFDAWDAHVLRDYCTFGAHPDPAGDGWILACRPEYEAEIYMTSRGNGGIHQRVHEVRAPVLVVRAMEPPPEREFTDFRYSPTWPALAAAFSDGRDLHLAARTHFLPMEAPALVAELILEAERAPSGTAPAR